MSKKENENKKQFVIKRYKSNKLVVFETSWREKTQII